MTSLNIFLASITATTLVMLLLIRMAPRLHLLDHPGGRKEHARITPVIGGLGIALVLLVGLFILQPQNLMGMALAVLVILLIGLADDIREIAPLPKFLAQAGACLIMIFLGKVQLNTVGNLLGFGVIGMWVLAVPMTVFAVIGVINAINMADGIDGHAGGIGLVTFIAYAYVARDSGLWDQYKILLVLAGATTGYLILNARWPWNERARTFLGDAGSMMLGFLIGWFAIDLSAGNGSVVDSNHAIKTFPAICALWVIVIPLCDCVSLMIRRKRAGHSMFMADRQHLHHYLLNRGFSVGQASAASIAASAVCAVIGVGGWKMGVPEPIMFAAFVALFVVYHLHMQKAFNAMPQHSQMSASNTI